MVRNKFKANCRRTVIPYVGGRPIKHFCKTDVMNKNENHGFGNCALSK